MNIAQAKRIPLELVLEKIGAQHVQKRGGDIWYLSPFRVEETPSFKINTSLNTWKDFGAVDGRTGGTIIDFGLTYLKTESVKDVLHWIRGFSLAPSDTIQTMPKAPATKTTSETFRLKSVKILHERALINYIESRGIPAIIARDYCKQVHYEHIRHGKTYFAIGFENKAGGYDLRNPYFKGCIGSKTFTFFNQNPTTELTIFEGFMDFLSWITLNNNPTPNSAVMVLNGIENRQAAVRFLQNHTKHYDEISLYVDNDQGGDTTVSYFKAHMAGVNDCRHKYHPHNDLNALIASKSQNNHNRKLGL